MDKGNDRFFRDIKDSIDTAKTAFDLFKVLKLICDTYDFKYFIILNFLDTAERRLADRAILSNWETEQIYAALGDGVYAQDDGLGSDALGGDTKSGLPQSFSVAGALEAPGGGQRRKALEFFRGHGQDRIAILPVWSGRDQAGVVAFSGTRPALAVSEEMALAYLCQQIYATLARLTLPEAKTANPLSEREVECLRAAANGLTTEEIAGQIGITPHTVNYHSTSAVRKLGGRNRMHAVALAIRSGWLK